jgi:hypothetical protein
MKLTGSLFTLVAKIFLAIGILTAFVLVVNQCHTEQAHVVRLQADSTKKVTLINKLTRQADDALAFAQKYRFQRDSANKASDSTNALLSYSAKVVSYLQGLVDNQTLPAEVAKAKPDLTDERVVLAGLNTISREANQRKVSDQLYESVALRDAKISALRQDKLTLKEGLLKVKQKALPRTKQGFLFIKAAARKQAKETVKQVDETLQQSELSELEIISNQKY